MSGSILGAKLEQHFRAGLNKLETRASNILVFKMPLFGSFNTIFWHFKYQNSSCFMLKIRHLNTKKWYFKYQFRHFKCKNLFVKLTPRLLPELI